MFKIQLIKFYFIKLKRYTKEYRDYYLEYFFRRFVVKNKDVFEVLYHANYVLAKKKQNIVDMSHRKSKIIFFVFRDYQMLDWFIPIHRSLVETYGDLYSVLYINYGSTLPRVGTGFNYILYLRTIEKRLDEASIPNCLHFSDCEINLYKNFPSPDLILSSEVIRAEKFTCSERIYLPHYSVPKATKSLRIMKHFKYVFLPSKSPFTYQDLSFDGEKYKAYPIGYPKIEYHSNNHQKLFDDDKPVIIYAPNLELDIVFDTLEKGILKIFQKMTEFNFLIKMHPTLANKTFNMFQLIKKEVERAENIKIDTHSNIENVGFHSTMMITDFGSVGAEYKLRFAKRIIYLDIPKHLEGGADLTFRDHFADAVTEVGGLSNHIKRLQELGDLSEYETRKMTSEVLYNYGSSDQEAAKMIYEILENAMSFSEMDKN